MPAVTFTSNGQHAVNLFNLSMLLKGDPAQFKERAKVRETILKTWPELDIENPEQRPEEKDLTAVEKFEAAQNRIRTETRSFDISSTQRTALAEGFAKFLKDMDVSDKEKELALSLAKKVKCAKFLDDQIAKVQIREFGEGDETIEVDPEPAHG